MEKRWRWRIFALQFIAFDLLFVTERDAIVRSLDEIRERVADDLHLFLQGAQLSKSVVGTGVGIVGTLITRSVLI